MSNDQLKLDVEEIDAKIDGYQRLTISLPLSILIKLDLEREKGNYSRSAFVRLILENSLYGKQKPSNELEVIDKKLEEIKKILTEKK
jgi:hypothetical protein